MPGMNDTPTPRTNAEANFDRLVQAVRVMRAAQREWFATHNSAKLYESKNREREVDALLREIEIFGQPKQGELL